MKAKTPATLLAATAWAITVSILGAGPPPRHTADTAGALPSQPAAAFIPAIDFDRQIRPVLAARCLECHNQEQRKGGLSLATYADALEGGRSGAAVRPGNAQSSLLLQRLRGEITPQMPLGRPPLDPAEVARIGLWIDEGARATPSSPPAPPPWEAPLALSRPPIPPQVWTAWTAPVDRFVAAYLVQRSASPARRGAAGTVPPAEMPPRLVSDAIFARRVFLDVWGFLPPPDVLRAFLADRTVDKRAKLIEALLADNERYAEHWISFWNDLLRNEDGVSYFSETAGRRSITSWLLRSLVANVPYDRFVRELLNPASPGGPEGFLIGVNWRGETSAAVTPWMQASQNTAQVFLGVNLKCNACHDSFINRWKLADAYSLAAYFSPEPRLQLFRCDIARNQYAEPRFLYPQLNRAPESGSLTDRRAAAAAIFTDSRNGRMPRTIVNRIWQRLFGRGVVSNPDDMDGRPWSPELLDWVASDFVEHQYDLKHLLATLLSSHAYQLPSVPRAAEPPARDYVFGGPEVRRLTAEQFADAVGAITGEWSVYEPPGQAAGSGRPPAGRDPVESDPVSIGRYGREWRAPSNDLSRALGRPIRDQVTSVRADQATTLQALELVNGETLTHRLQRGARRMLGALPPEPVSLFTKAVAGRTVVAHRLDIDVSSVSTLWLIVDDTGSNAPERIKPLWAEAALIRAGASISVSSLTPTEASGLRSEAGPIALNGRSTTGVRVKNPSRLAYDIAGKGFTRFRATIGVENPPDEIGATLNPQLRFFVFDTEPNMEQLRPPAMGTPPAADAPATPSPAGAQPWTMDSVVDRLFWYALGRPPSAPERQAAREALRDPARADRPWADGLADLLWAILMKPEFQLIY